MSAFDPKRTLASKRPYWRIPSFRAKLAVSLNMALATDPAADEPVDNSRFGILIRADKPDYFRPTVPRLAAGTLLGPVPC